MGNVPEILKDLNDQFFSLITQYNADYCDQWSTPLKIEERQLFHSASAHGPSLSQNGSKWLDFSSPLFFKSLGHNHPLYTKQLLYSSQLPYDFFCKDHDQYSKIIKQCIAGTALEKYRYAIPYNSAILNNCVIHNAIDSAFNLAHSNSAFENLRTKKQSGQYILNNLGPHIYFTKEALIFAEEDELFLGHIVQFSENCQIVLTNSDFILNTYPKHKTSLIKILDLLLIKDFLNYFQKAPFLGLSGINQQIEQGSEQLFAKYPTLRSIHRGRITKLQFTQTELALNFYNSLYNTGILTELNGLFISFYFPTSTRSEHFQMLDRLLKKISEQS